MTLTDVLEQARTLELHPDDYLALRDDATKTCTALIPYLDSFVFAAAWAQYCDRFKEIPR